MFFYCIAEYLYTVNPFLCTQRLAIPTCALGMVLIHPTHQGSLSQLLYILPPLCKHLSPISLLPSAFRSNALVLFASSDIKDPIKGSFSVISVDSRNYHISELHGCSLFISHTKSKI